MTSDQELLRTLNLKKYFPLRKGINPFRRSLTYVKAVDGVSISMGKGTTLGIVGESGCGKTTLARTIALLTRPTEGEIYFSGIRIDDGKVGRKQIYKDMQMVFQDPDSSLDPRMRVMDLIGEPLRGLLGYSDSEAKDAVYESLNAVGLSQEFADRLPRQLSGGQKQRVAIARAIAPRPRLVILDEPTSALDASVQAQILRLLVDLQKGFSLSYMLITHNISVAKYLADNIAVMYSGKIVEYGPVPEVVERPRHPYTVALVSSAPVPDPRNRNLLQVEVRGEVPSAIDPPAGCRFNPRCPYAENICKVREPELRNISEHSTYTHLVACHFVEKTKYS